MSYSNGPRMVTNGLVLYLDAGNSKSYPGSGTVWNDLSGNGNNGTLVNGPTYNSSNKGSIVFDGVNDFGAVTHNNTINMNLTNRVTISAWFFATSDGLSSTREIVNKRNNSPTFVSYGLSWFLQGIENKIFSRIGFVDGSFSDLTSSALNKNVWYYSTQVFDGSIHYLYINNTLSNSSSPLTNKTIADNSQNITIGTYNQNVEFFNGRVAQISIYNRALSANEVSQNYNALKGRYNL